MWNATTAALTSYAEPVVSTEDDYCITMEAKSTMAAGAGSLIVEYIKFPN